MGNTNKNPQEVTDAIQRVKEGDVQSYDIIYNHTDGSLRDFISARYYWAGPDFVDEVSARTHLSVRPRLDEYKEAKASLRTWYNWQGRGVAKQVLYEWRGRSLVQYDDAAHEVYAVTATGPVDVYEEERLSRILQEEPDSLPEDERQTVLLHDRDGLTFAETAEATEQSVMQVKVQTRAGSGRTKAPAAGSWSQASAD